MSAEETTRRPMREVVLLLVVFALALQSAWLLGRETVSLFDATNVFAHFFVGIAAAVALGAWMRGLARRRDAPGRLTGLAGAGLLILSAACAIVLAIISNTRPHRPVLLVHEGLALAGTVLLLLHVVTRLMQASPRARSLALVAAVASLGLAGLWLRPLVHEAEKERIVNPTLPPLAMADESMGGAKGPFFPSSVMTSTGGRIPSDFLMTSESCGRSGCHSDIVSQWKSSMHHFASFNNQFYRKSVEYMQSVVGVEPSKWCAGCHDIALLLDGKFDRPVQELIDRPEARAGLACTSCHAIEHVKGSMGQGGYTITYPPLHDLAASDNPLLRGLHDAYVKLDPGPHRKLFLKDFHREQRAEFCSTCHKVHLDVPVNAYRWMRGFNDYDNWQASGVSGMGARSFYEPEKPSDCVDCHMPLTPSKDAGNVKGFVHDHHFAAANTAVPTANQDPDQVARVEAFLKDKVTVDVFALVRTPAAEVQEGEGVIGYGGGEPRLNSSFAVGEESATPIGTGGAATPDAQVIAPIDRAGAAVHRGESVRVDVVVRTRGVGHFFPGGTVDAFDCWVELKAEDETGRPIFWSGKVEDDGKGAVEPGAHFYRTLALDEHGNPINKRNAWAMRSVMYVRLIPPGAADTVHYRVLVPKDCGNEIHLEAALHYRKFAHSYTEFAYAGHPDPAAPPEQLGKGFDDRPWSYDGDMSKVSGQLHEIPDVPIVTLNRAKATLKVLDPGVPLPEPVAATAEDRPRFNDYGIGLLLQNDLRGALAAFRKVTELDPAYADGFVNVARVRLREGDTTAALVAVDHALELKKDMPKAHFFRGEALKTEGRLDEALVDYLSASASKPKDRVVLNSIARVHFLRSEFKEALEWGQKALAIDPEDLMAHYTMMLAARGLGDEEQAAVHEKLYRRFKADEDAQILTGDYRRTHPWDNTERQPIHEHLSVALDVPAAVGQ
jgi:tetratricopeptide (TPR) repeat protein